MKEAVSNLGWALGVRAWRLARHWNLALRVEPALWHLALALAPPPGKDTQISLRSGVTLLVPSGYRDARIMAAGLYESDVTRLFGHLITDGMTVVDLGAHVGYYTILASRLVGSSGLVYAFEPDPTSYAYLLKNIETNRCRNVVPVPQAVSDKSGLRNFSRDPRGAEGSLTTRLRNVESIVVPAVALDDYFREQSRRIDIMKMDIEGGEMAALQGMRQLATEQKPRLIMEFSLGNMRAAGVTRKDLQGLLTELGYRTSQVIERGLEPVPLPDLLPSGRGVYNLMLAN